MTFPRHHPQVGRFWKARVRMGSATLASPLRNLARSGDPAYKRRIHGQSCRPRDLTRRLLPLFNGLLRSETIEARLVGGMGVEELDRSACIRRGGSEL